MVEFNAGNRRYVVLLPESMMYVVLIPIIQDKKAKISSIDNYIPV